jgi:hypothetical protein
MKNARAKLFKTFVFSGNTVANAANLLSSSFGVRKVTINQTQVVTAVLINI